MSLEYNPEAHILERIGTLEVEAAQIARKRDAAGNQRTRQTLERQLKDVEEQIDGLRRNLRARRQPQASANRR